MNHGKVKGVAQVAKQYCSSVKKRPLFLPLQTAALPSGILPAYLKGILRLPIPLHAPVPEMAGTYPAYPVQKEKNGFGGPSG